MTDSQSGEVPGEWLDQQAGGNNVKAAATWEWGDSERIMDNWSDRLAKGLNAQVHGGATSSSN